MFIYVPVCIYQLLFACMAEQRTELVSFYRVG